MSYTIKKEEINVTLFNFLKSIYTLQTVEQDLFGVSWQEVFLLQIINRKPRMRVTELTERLRVKKFATSRLVTKLEKLGLVDKISNDSDKRVVLVEITSAGKQVIDEIEEYNYQLIASQFENFEKEDLMVILNSISSLDKVFNLDQLSSQKIN